MRQGKGWCPFADQIEGVLTFNSGGNPRVGFCDHTAGGYYGTLISPSFWNDAGTSVHFSIAQDGRIAQIINIFDTAYAQGKLGPTVSWPPYGAMNRENPNLYLISTEHEDKTVTNYKWSDEMYAADLKVKRWCVEECGKYAQNPLQFGLDSLAGHYMFDDVDRAYCPGNGWPREKLYADLAAKSDKMIRYNAIAPSDFWSQRTVTGVQAMDARFDFKLPTEAKMIRLEVFLNGGTLSVQDGKNVNGPYAGQIRGDYGIIDVEIPDGWLSFKGVAVISLLGIVGYWT